MSWAEIKSALNSTLGTPEYIPLDKMFTRGEKILKMNQNAAGIQYVSEEIALPYDILPGAGALEVSHYSLKVPYSGDAILNFTFKSNLQSAGMVDIWLNGQRYDFKTGSSSASIEYKSRISFRRGDIITIYSTDGGTIRSVKLLADVIDGEPLIDADILEKDGLIYTHNTDGTLQASLLYTEIGEKWVIPDRVGGIPVRSIAHHGWKADTQTEGVFLPDTITEIGESAFSECTGLRYINLPLSIKTIGDNAFSGCSAIQTLYVEWAQGAVAGAPWGLPSGRISYNYKRPKIGG